MDLADVKQLEQQYQFDLYSHIRQPVLFVRGEGTYLWDHEGRRYLDFVSGGRAVMSLGHCHPRVVAAVREQAGRLLHVSNDYYSAPQFELAGLLAQVCVCQRAFFCNSGAEANEAAIKLARKYAKGVGGAGKTQIITALNSFHGRTLATMTATGQPKYQQGFEPLVPGFTYVPYNDPAALEAAVGEQTAAVMLEPILGESGAFPATPAYLQAARAGCDRVGAVLILDEVQTGLGRTGRMFAYEHYGIEPDLITLSKALGGGLPIGAMLAKEHVAAAFSPGDHASTFGGSAITAAAACAAVRTIIEEDLPGNAARLGSYLGERLGQLGPPVKEVRATGLLIGMDLETPQAAAVKTQCRERGLLINTVGDSMLRLMPPLIITREQADQGLAILAQALKAV